MTGGVEMATRPAWLDDTPQIRMLLEEILNRLDRQPASLRQRSAGITLDEKTLPALFCLGEEADRLWDLLRSLGEEHGVVQIARRKQKDPFAPEYLKARITLRDGGEAILRAWLNRPQGASPLQAWRQTVAQHADRFPGSVEKLQAHRIALAGLEDAVVVQGFLDIERYQQQDLSLRQLSSRCFHGNSKFLDNREELLRELYPDLKLTPRSVMVNAFLPANIEGVLFIENQDSYLQAVSGALPGSENLVLVYVAGFRGSAAHPRATGREPALPCRQQPALPGRDGGLVVPAGNGELATMVLGGSGLRRHGNPEGPETTLCQTGGLATGLYSHAYYATGGKRPQRRGRQQTGPKRPWLYRL